MDNGQSIAVSVAKSTFAHVAAFVVAGVAIASVGVARAQSELAEPRQRTLPDDPRLHSYMMLDYPNEQLHSYVDSWTNDEDDGYLVLIYYGSNGRDRVAVMRAVRDALDLAGETTVVMARQSGPDDSISVRFRGVNLSRCSVDTAAGAREVFPTILHAIAQHNVPLYQNVVGFTQQRVRNFEELVYDLGNSHQADELEDERKRLIADQADLSRWERWLTESYAQLSCANIDPQMQMQLPQ